MGNIAYISGSSPSVLSTKGWERTVHIQVNRLLSQDTSRFITLKVTGMTQKENFLLIGIEREYSCYLHGLVKIPDENPQ